MGLAVPAGLGAPNVDLDNSSSTLTLSWSSTASVTVSKTADDVCYWVKWVTRGLNSVRDCFEFGGKTRWFVGPEENEQHFPLSKTAVRNSIPYLPGRITFYSHMCLRSYIRLCFYERKS